MRRQFRKKEWEEGNVILYIFSEGVQLFSMKGDREGGGAGERREGQKLRVKTGR